MFVSVGCVSGVCVSGMLVVGVGCVLAFVSGGVLVWIDVHNLPSIVCMCSNMLLVLFGLNLM